MANTVQFACPQCDHSIEVGIRFAGQTVKCPECRTECVVPTVVAEPSPADEQPNSVADAPADVTAASSQSSQPACQSGQSTWMLRVPEGLQFGPIPHSLLQQWLLEGRIDGECQLRREEEAVWRPADEEFPILKTASQLTPESAPSAKRIAPEPSAGLFVLVLTILGWLALCPFLGLIGWMAAREDLAEIAAGRRRDDQRTWSLVAVRLAQIQLLLTIVLLLGMLALALFGGMANKFGW